MNSDKKLRIRIGGKLLAFLLLVSIVLPLPAAAANVPDESEYSYFFLRSLSEWPSHEHLADALAHLGLFQGTTKGYELTRSPNRAEALVTVIRLTGKEEEALSANHPTSFDDVPAWASSYVGYAEREGIVNGMSDTYFGAGETVTTKQYMTMMLRVLGYNDPADFSFPDAVPKAGQIGLIDRKAEARYGDEQTTMTRDDLVYIMHRMLGTSPKDEDECLLFGLVKEGAVSESLACGTMKKKGESHAEIERALRNGYSEAWLAELMKAIESNVTIVSSFKARFSETVYQWLKEPGTPETIPALLYRLPRLTARTALASEQALMTKNGYAGYFTYPSTIVISQMLDVPHRLGALSHELRHAMTANIGILLLEEGFTDLFSQEVNHSYPAYPYYYLNITKFFTHLLGSRPMVLMDVAGSYETIFYELETNLGQKIPKQEIKSALMQCTYDNAKTEALLETAVRPFLFQLLVMHYERSMDALSHKAPEDFVDELLALGQLIYYPSAMIQNVESDLGLQAPETYLPPAFHTFATDVLRRYAVRTGVSFATVSELYRVNQASRLCFEYFGENSGKLFVKDKTAFTVLYRSGKKTLAQTLPTRARADAFGAQVSLSSIRELPLEAFRIK